MFIENFWKIFCLTQCCSNYWMPNNLTELDFRLQSQLIGQPLAHELILGSIRSHLSLRQPAKSLVLSLHGTTGTGKNFVVKHVVESLYRDGFKSRFIQFYVASRDFMHNDPVNIALYKDRLVNDIESAAKYCSQAMFIFDEIDLMPKALLDVIIYYLDFRDPTIDSPIDFRRTIFIFLSNAGSQSIVEETKVLHSQTIAREHFQVLPFQKLLMNASLHEQGSLWHAPLIERHLVSFFVPFLPLERQHVRQCIENEFQRQFADEAEKLNFSRVELVNRVLDLIEMDSSSSFVYSLSGCKKVPEKLSFVFESFRRQSMKDQKNRERHGRDQL